MNIIHIDDVVYGQATITEPVLIDLINAPSVQRLKKISQYGIPDHYYHLKNYSRYEHSLGVMILLRNLGVSLDEQVAGLLHDVSHLAFSHVIDFLYGQGKKGIEDHQDSIHAGFINKTEIPDILKHHGFAVQRIFSYDDYPILEKNQPELCADRVDFALREFQHWLNPKIVASCVTNLKVYKHQLVFGSLEAAYLFGLNYLELQTRHWGSYEAMMRYYLFSEALRQALDNKEINKDDFLKTEQPIIQHLEKSPDPAIQKILHQLENRELPVLPALHNKKIYKKFRFVDPPVLLGKDLKKLSSIKPDFYQLVEKHRHINQQGLVV
jgi:hypothetical protein